ncbi:5'-3' exonuclease H3TH domain-containing protein [Patescibacteria group bacterium]
MSDLENKKTLVIIDSNSVIHRAYHALPKLTTKKGKVVSAVYGFLLVFFKAIKDFQPDFIVAAFDVPGPTFRHKKYSGYKAKRPPAPQELYQQIPIVKEVLRSFNVSVLEKEGFEADDIIATVASKAPKKQVLPEIETIIVSGDTDSLQLIDEKTKVYILRKGIKDTILYDKMAVKEKYSGLVPNQLLSYKALRGDPSDNIPGVTGVGEKTATELILNFGNLEKLYKAIEERPGNPKNIKTKLKETLLQYRDQAFLSESLAKPEKNVSIDFNLKNSRWGNYNKEKVAEIFEKLNFYSLIEKIPIFGNKGKELVGKKTEVENGEQGTFF